jgi:hypothetical protein
MMNKGPVCEYLRQIEASEPAIAAGLPGLVENWERIVQSVAGGYPLELDSYLNDMDARQLIEEVLEFASDEEMQPVAERIAAADELMKSLIKPTARCLWSDQVAFQAGWTADKNWWYFNRPITAGPELLADLESQNRER